jgi:hypothetical protein
MEVTIILFLSTLTITCIALYLVKNSHFYRDEEPVKLPLGLWILLIFITLIPILNVIICIIGIVFVFNLYDERELEFNEDFWLMKKY